MADPKVQALMQNIDPMQRQDKVQPDEDVLEYFGSISKKHADKVDARAQAR